MLVYKRSIQMLMDTGTVDIAIGPNAVRHMQHYMNMTGNDLIVDLRDFAERSKKLKEIYIQEIHEAKEFSQTLPIGTHFITSETSATGYFDDSKDLYYAIGGYSYWGKGTVAVMKNSESNNNSYAMDFEFHFFDRYNWDKGKEVHIGAIPITDEFMGEFHRQCYAMEYNIKGVYKETIVWAFEKK